MSDDKAVIAGTFADFKLIKTRSTAQLIIEVPIEHADIALTALGGIPQPGKECSVAVARMDIKKKKPFERPGKRVTLAQQAALLCGDESFREFLVERSRTVIGIIDTPQSSELAADVVRNICEVESRAEFDSDPAAAERWSALHVQYRDWLQTQ
jgi:hypothetical protein